MRHKKHVDNIITVKTLKPYCVYCGCLAEHLDHFLPWSAYQRPYSIPSCSQCNRYLSDTVHTSFQERLIYLKDRYLKKNISELKTSYPDPEKFTGNIRESIRQSIEYQNYLKVKTEWLTKLIGMNLDIDLFNLLPDSLEQDTLQSVLSLMVSAKPSLEQQILALRL